MKNKKYGKAFWPLQIGGWGLLMVLTFWAKILHDNDISDSYFLVEGLIFFSLAIATTTILRSYLKKIRLIEDQSVSNYLKTFGVAILLGLLFATILLLLVNVAFYFIENHQHLGMSALEILVNYINITLYVIMWCVLYIVIKSSLKLRNEKIRRLELEAALKEAQLNTLKGQINPHFMFNSLNNIRALILENPHKSREMLTSLSEMLRASLNADMTDTITVREELETVKNFIALSTIQMEDRLHYEQEVDDQLMDARIPPMMLQLVIENAIKHGISTLPEGGKVKLSISQTADKMQIAVSNDGRLLSGSTGTSVGIKNIKDRLRILYNGEADFSIKFEDGKVMVRIHLPLFMNQS